MNDTDRAAAGQAVGPEPFHLVNARDGSLYRPAPPPAGASMVPTDYYEQTIQFGRQMFAVHGSLKLEGPPGTGKTTAAIALCRALGVPVLPLHLASTAHGHEVVRGMLRTLGEDTSGVGQLLRERAATALARRPMVVFLDEAHLLNKEALQTIRWLFDQPDAKFLLLLTGVDFTRAWRICPEFPSRIARQVDFVRLAGKDLTPALARHHPVLKATPRPTLQRLDRRICKGTWRKWDQVLYFAVGYGATAETGIVDAIADAAILSIPPEAG